MIIMLLVTLIVGIVIGGKALSTPGHAESASTEDEVTSVDIKKTIYESMKAENIRKYHR